jgi:phosphoheptose isomerase
MFLLNSDSKSTLNLQDIILDGNGGTSDKTFAEVNSGSTLNINNVVFQNCTITHESGFIYANDNSTVTINGLTATNNCTVPENKGVLRVGNTGSSANVTLTGNNNMSVYLKTTHTISASDLTNESPINIYTTNHTNGSIVVKGWTDSSKFKLMNSDYTLMGKDGNLVLGAESSTTGNVKIGNSVFADLASAVKAAKDGDVIDVTDYLSVEGTLNAEGRNLTIRGNRPTKNNSKVIRREDGSNVTATIIRTGADMLILANHGETVTLQNLNIDGKNVESANNLIEASGNSTVVLNNVEIADAKSSNALGLVVAKGGGSLSLTDVEINNSTVNASTGTVFVGNYSTATLSGSDVVSVSLESNSTLVDAGLTNTKENPISLYAYAGNGTTFGSATIAAAEGVTVNAEKFSTTEDYALTANTSNNTLTFAAKVVNGVEGVNADDVNAPVEYFNLQGQRVANPANGIFIRRQGNTVTKVSLR